MVPVRRNPTLSDDLISEILVRVPVKSLFRFQSVCKTWSSLIKEPAFVKSQLRHAITKQTDQTLIITHYKAYKEKHIFSLLHVDSREFVSDLEFPYSQGKLDTQVVGSANGIVCFVLINGDDYFNRTVHLLNPAIRQIKVIPSYSIEFHSKELVGLFRYDGFGYDPIDHDYKVVRTLSRNSLSSSEVYSANENVWRKVPDPIERPWNRGFDVCVNGYLCGTGNYGMMSFDLNKEVFNLAIKLPVVYDRARDEACIVEFNKSVGVVILINAWNRDKNDRRLDKKINMWSLDDDACLRGGGAEALWTIMFSIDVVTPCPTTIFLGFFSNGNLLLLLFNNVLKWISCNADKKEAKIFPPSADMAVNFLHREFYRYTESLVSLAGFKQVNCNFGEDDN
ncbi:F-box domain-containing protein [Heracleum sosnowskyi]|uniref:F-box domain-containing protein n=1 Tax=Heracleum sosnowskyi TaxID=360622 RepID=A0AAD8GQ39_9APIA|nr:F-box domain-containing protein [Heracleum sosnowskyi]